MDWNYYAKPYPIYLNKAAFLQIGWSDQKPIYPNCVNFEQGATDSGFYLVSDTINAESGNMHFEAEVQNTYEERNGICHKDNCS